MEIAAGEALAAEQPCRLADCQHFRVGGRIGELPHGVSRLCDDASVARRHHRADRNLAGIECRARLFERERHGLPCRAVLNVSRHRRTMLRMERIGQAPETRSGERVAKVIARSGLCSRRAAEALVLAGRVALNGTTLATPAVTVNPGDRVEVDGRPIAAPEPPRLWRYHKPSGLVTTNRDPEGRPTIFERLPADLPRVISVGRLDISTEGLLLLTNDGGLARALELPQTGWLRRYRVRVHGKPDAAALQSLARGITLDGTRYREIDARIERQQGSNAWITIALREGKNREVKNVLSAFDLKVTRLIRVGFGPFSLGAMARGAVEEVPRRILRDQLPEPFRGALTPPRPDHARRRR